MLPKDLIRFMQTTCYECSSCHDMWFDKDLQVFTCEECYRELPYDETEPNEIGFDTYEFVTYAKSCLKTRPVYVQRLISLYMDHVNDPTIHNSLVNWIRNKHQSLNNEQ